MRRSQLLFTLMMLASAAAHADDDTLFVKAPLSFEANPLIAESVKLDCGGAADYIGKRVFQTLADAVPGARVLEGQEPPADSRVLKLRISDLRGGEREVQGYPSRMTAFLGIRADFYRGSKLAATRVFQRRTFVLQERELCDAREKLAVTVGKDIASWLPVALAAGESDALGAGSRSSMALQLPVTYDAVIPDSAKSDCNVSELVGKHALLQMKRYVKDVRPVSAAEAAEEKRVLRIVVAAYEATNNGGGNFGRSITIRADLVDAFGSPSTQTFSKVVATSMNAPCLNAEAAARAVAHELALSFSAPKTQR